jgi:hypothetical protein
MKTNFGYEACRVCLKSSTVKNLKSLFDEAAATNLEMFQHIVGFNVSRFEHEPANF